MPHTSYFAFLEEFLWGYSCLIILDQQAPVIALAISIDYGSDGHLVDIYAAL
ncbi:MAG TPA: hypothetical protein VFA09_23910 [Ktedonobacteraceae bacterium]|nr:hypothetical protein [Ktedonobacteraceae bacterium]